MNACRIVIFITWTLLGINLPGREAETRINGFEIRLDRVIVNTLWNNLFQMAKVYNLEGSHSDHNHLLLLPEQQMSGYKKRHFCFENAWLMKPMCFQIIKDCWEEENELYVRQKVKKNVLGAWKFGVEKSQGVLEGVLKNVSLN